MPLSLSTSTPWAKTTAIYEEPAFHLAFPVTMHFNAVALASLVLAIGPSLVLGTCCFTAMGIGGSAPPCGDVAAHKPIAWAMPPQPDACCCSAPSGDECAAVCVSFGLGHQSACAYRCVGCAGQTLIGCLSLHTSYPRRTTWTLQDRFLPSPLLLTRLVVWHACGHCR